MARATHGSGDRSLTLQGIDGRRRVTLHPASAARRNGRATSDDATDVLLAAFKKRAKNFRKRLRASTATSRDDIDERVHDLRTAARRLLATLDALQCFVGKAATKPLARAAEKALDRVARLRDLTIQREILDGLRAHSALFDAFEASLRRKHERLARTVGKRLDSVRRKKLRRNKKRLKKHARRCLVDARNVRTIAIRSANESLARVGTARAAIDPNDPDSLHKMRIALKQFRYLMEVLRPALPRIDDPSIESLHTLQSALGDLHDLDVLTESIAKFVRKHAPRRAAEATAVLERVERRHCAILLSCLRGIDVIVRPWHRALAA